MSRATTNSTVNVDAAASNSVTELVSGSSARGNLIACKSPRFPTIDFAPFVTVFCVS